jgi:hypothetical protein
MMHSPFADPVPPGRSRTLRAEAPLLRLRTGTCRKDGSDRSFIPMRWSDDAGVIVPCG